MAVDEARLRKMLEARNFFALAQASYRRHVEAWKQAEVEAGVKRRKPFRKEEKEILEDTPPYPKIAERLLHRIVHAAERWEQMNDSYVKEERPLLQYVAGPLWGDLLCHAEKHGLLYPTGHEFWNEWTPPNSFPCSCSVMSVSLDLLDRRRKGEGALQWRDGPPLTSFQFLHPDEGFAFNAGKLLAL